MTCSSRRSVLALLALLLLFTSLPLTRCQVQFSIAASPLGHAVATSVTDQGSLVLERLRTRKALQAQQRMQGAFNHRSSRTSPDQPLGVYECTSLDGPACAWLNGDDEPTDNAAAVQRIIQQLLRKSQPAQRVASVTPNGAAGAETEEQREGEQTVGLVELMEQLLGQASAEESSEVGQSDGESRGTEEGVGGGPATSDGVRLQVTDGAAEGEEGYAVEWEVVEGESGDGGWGEGGDDGVEYELVAIGEDGETRPMTDEEMEAFTQQVLAGNVHINYGEDDEEEQGEEEGEAQGEHGQLAQDAYAAQQQQQQQQG